MFTAEATTVLTTPERADLFRAVVGRGADFILDDLTSVSLSDLLRNIVLSGGGLVVIDEAHFVNADRIKRGLLDIYDDPHARREGLSLIVVCSERAPGDPFLNFLVSYCGIFDVIYDCDSAELSMALLRLMNRPNSRVDVLKLFDVKPFDSLRHAEARGMANIGAINALNGEGASFRINIDVHIEPLCS